MPDAIDQSWDTADPATAAAAGVRVVSMYLSWDSSKNVTPARVRLYWNKKIGVLINWEAVAGAPLKGAGQGRADATEAVRQLIALLSALGVNRSTLGYRICIYFSCDTDVSLSQLHGPVADYYRAAARVCHAAGFDIGCYGEFDLVQYLSGERITDAEWQTYAWSGGKVSPAADFYQYQNGQRLGGASVDFDKIIHESNLGALWYPGYVPKPIDNPPTPASTEGFGTMQDSQIIDQFNQIKTLVREVHNFKGDSIDPKTGKPVSYTGTVQGTVRGELMRALVNVNAQLAALQTAVGQIAKGDKLDLKAVEAAAAQGAKDTLAQYELILQKVG